MMVEFWMRKRDGDENKNDMGGYEWI